MRGLFASILMGRFAVVGLNSHDDGVRPSCPSRQDASHLCRYGLAPVIDLFPFAQDRLMSASCLVR